MPQERVSQSLLLFLCASRLANTKTNTWFDMKLITTHYSQFLLNQRWNLPSTAFDSRTLTITPIYTNGLQKYSWDGLSLCNTCSHEFPFPDFSYRFIQIQSNFGSSNCRNQWRYVRDSGRFRRFSNVVPRTSQKNIVDLYVELKNLIVSPNRAQLPMHYL